MSKGRLDHRVSLPSAASQLRVGAWCGPGRRAAALVLCLVLGVLGSVCEAFGQAAMPPGWTPYGYTRPYYGDYGRVPRPVQQVVTGAGERAWFYGDLAYGALQGMSYLLSCGYAVLPNPPAQSPALQNFDRSCKEDGFWSTTGSNFIGGVNPYEWGRGIGEPLCNDAFALGMGDECAWESCKLLGGLAVDGVVARPVQGIGRPISGGKPGRIIVPEDPLQNIVAYAKPEPVPGFESTSIILGGPGPVSTIFQLRNPSGYSGYLAGRIPGLSTAQADFLLERAGQSSVCFGGSRIRGNFCAGSDLDVGFGSLSVNQAKRIINACNARVDTGNFPLRLDRTPIVPGFSPNSGAFSTILSPEEFFSRCGIRSCTDGPKAGQPFSPSGSITYDPNFGIMILYP